jgi:chromosome partitioning protein
MRTNLAKNSVDIIREAYGAQVRIYSMPIPYSVKVKEASSVGKSIFAYEGGNPAATAYESLTKEVLSDARNKGAVVRAAKDAPSL